MSSIQKFINSLPGQFIIGGLTVAGIAGFSNRLHNPLLAGIVASVPVGMPSSVFVSKDELASYTWNLLVMTTVLFLATFVNWYMISIGYDKYQSVGTSMFIWALLGTVYYFAMKKKEML